MCLELSTDKNVLEYKVVQCCFFVHLIGHALLKVKICGIIGYFQSTLNL